MFKKVKLFWKANNFPFTIGVNYLKFASKAEKIFDFFLPAILSAVIIVIICIVDPETSTVVKGIKEINNQTLTFISILAGFNVASISVLATAGSTLLRKLKETKSEKVRGVSLFEVMMTFFCAAIVSQFVIILLGVVLLVISSLINIPSGFDITIWLWILIGIWIYILVLTIFISLRNLKILYYIMVHEEY